MKTKLFLDFDKTLFDTNQVKERLARIFSQLGFSQSEIKQTYLAESLDGKFDPEGQAKRLYKIRPFNIQIAGLKINSMIFDSNKFLYSDSINFLDSINRKKYEVNLLSYGNEDFQKRKVKHSGIIDKFDNVYITNIEKQIYLKSISEPKEYFIVIDDIAENLEKISEKFNRALLMLINRDIDNINEKCRFTVVEIRNLKQALEYL